MKTRKPVNTKKLVAIGLLSAIVVVLQLLGGGIKFGTFSITLVLIPIVVGAALYGWKAGAWLGFVFSCMAMLDASLFLGMNAFGTVVTVYAKGILCGLCAGLVYQLLAKKLHNHTVAVVAAAIICPIVNTGIFALGCMVFFIPGIQDLLGLTSGGEAIASIFTVFIGVNFFIELGVNLVLAPVITRLIRIAKK